MSYFINNQLLRSLSQTRSGLGFGSRVVVTPRGLATASRFRLLPEHRSGVLAPTQAKLLACSPVANQKFPTEVENFSWLPIVADVITALQEHQGYINIPRFTAADLVY